MNEKMFGEVITDDPAALIVPTAEWVNPYAGITEEEKASIMSEAEPPKIPQVEE